MNKITANGAQNFSQPCFERCTKKRPRNSHGRLQSKMGEALAFVAHHLAQDEGQNCSADTAGDNAA